MLACSASCSALPAVGGLRPAAGLTLRRPVGYHHRRTVNPETNP
jgi:hypothetical protein